MPCPCPSIPLQLNLYCTLHLGSDMHNVDPNLYRDGWASKEEAELFISELKRTKGTGLMGYAMRRLLKCLGHEEELPENATQNYVSPTL